MLKKLIPLMVLIFAAMDLPAQIQYNGVWHEGINDHKIWMDADWRSFRGKWSELSTAGYRLADIETAIINNEVKYYGVFHRGDGAYKLWADVDWQAFVSKRDEWKSQNLRLNDIEIHFTSRGKKFSGIWGESEEKDKLLVDIDWQTLQYRIEEFRSQGYRMVDIERYIFDGAVLYAAVWHQSEEIDVLLNDLDAETFQSMMALFKKNNMLLLDVEKYKNGGVDNYIAIWQGGKVTQKLVENSDWPTFLNEWKALQQNSMRLSDLEITGGDSMIVNASDPLQNTIDAVVEFAAGLTGSSSEPEKPAVKKGNEGKASYYSDDLHGKTTASGEIYDRDKLTAAHRTLAFGTLCRITNIKNDKSVTVRINDRGPQSGGLLIDLSYAAAEALDGIRDGIMDVRIEILK